MLCPLDAVDAEPLHIAHGHDLSANLKYMYVAYGIIEHRSLRSLHYIEAPSLSFKQSSSSITHPQGPPIALVQTPVSQLV
jgi:hypothetical protein